MAQTCVAPERRMSTGPGYLPAIGTMTPNDASADGPRRSPREARLYRWLAPDQEARELAQARALGAHAARLPEFIGRPWGDVVPLLVEAWAGRHDELCPERHDPRATFRGVREGWHAARGAA